ncbi:hypothetical protein AWZ03_013052 [Drosophila navojoa]|uniref:PDZ domain-containing protein n=1 Tax=Drosophila navojoa TaxID=7232 RepID=A0A484AV34_DRONA|nr:hypothetical protein AWZ03_013052 [Drosophila navojoa]
MNSSGEQQVVELSGYVIILVENAEGKIKLYGSPSDRDNLEVGDEILEVNGLSLDNISRTEAIRHIHDCIKSCTICLRVRKKNDSRLAGLGIARSFCFVTLLFLQSFCGQPQTLCAPALAASSHRRSPLSTRCSLLIWGWLTAALALCSAN